MVLETYRDICDEGLAKIARLRAGLLNNKGEVRLYMVDEDLFLKELEGLIESTKRQIAFIDGNIKEYRESRGIDGALPSCSRKAKSRASITRRTKENEKKDEKEKKVRLKTSCLKVLQALKAPDELIEMVEKGDSEKGYLWPLEKGDLGIKLSTETVSFEEAQLKPKFHKNGLKHLMYFGAFDYSSAATKALERLESSGADSSKKLKKMKPKPFTLFDTYKRHNEQKERVTEIESDTEHLGSIVDYSDSESD